MRVCHELRGESLRGGRRKPPLKKECNVHRNSPKGATATEGVSMPGAQRRAVRQGAYVVLGPHHEELIVLMARPLSERSTWDRWS